DVTNTDVAVGFGIPLDFGAGLSLNGSVTRDSAVNRSIVRTVLSGNPYWSQRNLFWFGTPTPASVTFQLGMDWSTNAYAQYDEHLDITDLACAQTHTFKGSAKGNLLTYKTGSQGQTIVSIEAGSHESTRCSAATRSLAASVLWRASPLQALEC